MQRASATLKYIQWPADFRRNSETLYNEVPKSVRDRLKRDEAICFVSGTGNQVMFIYKAATVGMTQGNSLHKPRKRTLVTSVRMRLNVGSFNPEMLANYADEVGIELVGLRRFEERYEHLLEAAA